MHAAVFVTFFHHTVPFVIDGRVCCQQIQMYQLSRLLHDYHRDLYCHLEQQDIAPSLYAPPWFLTTFASQYPLGFVARVFGESGGNGRM